MNNGFTIGGLIKEFEKLDPEHEVRFDFGYAVPDLTYRSNRGWYEDVSIGFKLQNNTDFERVSVSKFLDFLRGLIGAQWEGYKGGLFRGHRDTSVWVANSDADNTHTIIKEVRDLGYGYIILITDYED